MQEKSRAIGTGGRQAPFNNAIDEQPLLAFRRDAPRLFRHWRVRTNSSGILADRLVKSLNGYSVLFRCGSVAGLS